MKKIIKLGIVLVAFLSSRLIAANVINGSEKGEFFYPEQQLFQILKVEPSSSEIPKDLMGIPAILYGRTITLDEHYLVFPSVNTGGESVIGSCFTSVGNFLLATPLKPFQRVLGEEIAIIQNDDETISFSYGGYFKVTARKLNEAQIDTQVSNQYTEMYKSYVEKHKRDISQECEWNNVQGPKYVHNDLVLINELTGNSLVIKNGDRDVTSMLPNGSSQFKQFEVKDDLVINQCKAERYSVGLATMIKDYKGFYIVKGIIGKRVDNGALCTETTQNRYLLLADIAKVLGVKVIGLSTIKSSEWISTNSVNVKSKYFDFKITIDENKIYVSDL